MKTQSNISITRRNYYGDIIAVFPFLGLLVTGIIMLLYHVGKPYSETIFNLNTELWLTTHIVFAIITLVMAAIHLSLHLNWFKKTFSGKQKNNYWIRNLLLIILFLLVTITSVFPWLILDETDTANLLLGLHNKFRLLLIIFFVIHLASHSKWLISMTKKVFILET